MRRKTSIASNSINTVSEAGLELDLVSIAAGFDAEIGAGSRTIL